MSLSLQEIATVTHLKELESAFFERLEQIAPLLRAAEDKYLTVDEIAAFTGHHRKTVEGWIKKGKMDRTGHMVKLEVEEFCPGSYRALKSAVVAYGKVKFKEPEVKSRRNLKTA